MDQNAAPVEFCLQSTFSDSPGGPGPLRRGFFVLVLRPDSRLVSNREQGASQKQKVNPSSNN